MEQKNLYVLVASFWLSDSLVPHSQEALLLPLGCWMEGEWLDDSGWIIQLDSMILKVFPA